MSSKKTSNLLSVAVRLREAMKSLDLTQQEFAEKLSLTQAFISAVVGGKSGVSGLFFLAVEHVHGISRAWLERGEGEMMAARPGTTEVKFYGAADAAVKARRLEPGAYFLLPLVSGEVAAGPGAAVHEREIEDYIPSIYQRDWCPHPAETICVRVVGTSMESTIHDGGIVAVDRAQRDPRRLVGKVVALRRDGGVTVKRLTTAEGGLWIARPDNPQSPETLVFRDDEIVDAVVGKVVWSWSRMS